MQFCKKKYVNANRVHSCSIFGTPAKNKKALGDLDDDDLSVINVNPRRSREIKWKSHFPFFSLDQEEDWLSETEILLHFVSTTWEYAWNVPKKWWSWYDMLHTYFVRDGGWKKRYRYRIESNQQLVSLLALFVAQWNKNKRVEDADDDDEQNKRMQT